MRYRGNICSDEWKERGRRIMHSPTDAVRWRRHKNTVVYVDDVHNVALSVNFFLSCLKVSQVIALCTSQS